MKRFIVCLTLLALVLTFGAASATWADATGSTAVSAGPINVSLTMSVPASITFPQADAGTTHFQNASVDVTTNNANGFELKIAMLAQIDGKLVAGDGTKMANPLQYICLSVTNAAGGACTSPITDSALNGTYALVSRFTNGQVGALNTVVKLTQQYAAGEKAGVLFSGTVNWLAALRP